MPTLTFNDATMQDRVAEMQVRLRRAIEHALSAPSGHNSQPWKFRIIRDGVELYADRSRALPIVDPEDRALTISCGAALYQLRLAMNCDGIGTLVKILPDPNNPDLLARVLVSGPYFASSEDLELFDAFPRRRTNRGPFIDETIDPAVKTEWLYDAAESKCWLHMTEQLDEKEDFAELIDAGDHIQGSDKAFRHELSEWVRPDSTSRHDGIPGCALGMGKLESHFGRFMIRTFDWGDGQAAKDRQLAEGSPLIAVMGTHEDTPRAWLACGQSLAKMLLRGTARGLDASFMNQPIEVPELRKELSSLVDDAGMPQILLRWGRGGEVSKTARRSIEEVLVA